VLHRLPSAAQLARQVILADAVAAAVGFGAWSWAQGHRAGGMRFEVGLAFGALLLAAIVARWLVYRASSWEPSLPLALGAILATPLFAGVLLRGALVSEAVARPQTAGFALPHRTSTSRMGDTKRLSEL